MTALLAPEEIAPIDLSPWADRSLRRRRRVESVMRVVCGTAALLALAPLVAVVGYTISRGIGAWSVDFFSHLPTPIGVAGGGILNAIVGSAIIDGLAAAVAIPLGIGAGIVLSHSVGRFANRVRFAADVFAGIPSITLGIFAYAVLVATMHEFSALAASCALAMLMMPIVMRTSEAALRRVPPELATAGLALGARRLTVTWRVMVRCAFPGIMTGALLALARAVGETAPLLFTAIGSQFLVFSPFHPIAAMPLVTYQDGLQDYPNLQALAWGTACVLLVISLLLNMSGRALARRLGGATDAATMRETTTRLLHRLRATTGFSR